MLCACGCGFAVSTATGSRCNHCGNLALKDCLDDDVQDCCNICAQQMQLLNRNFSKVKKNVKLETTFRNIQESLRILPDNTMVDFWIDEDEIKTRISLRKLMEWFKIYYAAEFKIKISNVKSMSMVTQVTRHFYFKG